MSKLLNNVFTLSILTAQWIITFPTTHFVGKVFGAVAKLYQELALPKTNMRNDYVKQALRMFQLAKAVPCAFNKHLST